jgi:HNH endonuclease
MHARGLCLAHYRRLLKTGDARPLEPLWASPAERFWARVEKGSDCWRWMGYRTKHGHGQFGVGDDVVYAHRFAYEQAVGEIPDGHVLHHACGNPACVNPAHLQPMLQGDHVTLHRYASA